MAMSQSTAVIHVKGGKEDKPDEENKNDKE
jgi:hypothetical protein